MVGRNNSLSLTVICLVLLITLASACGSEKDEPVGETTLTEVQTLESDDAEPTEGLMNIGGTWTTGTEMPTGRWGHGACVVDGQIYIIGGAGPLYQALGTVEVYDPVTDTWTTKPEMPTPRQGLTTSVVNGKIYAIGGAVSESYTYQNVNTFTTVEEYDPTADTWTTKSPMPTSRGFHSAVVIGGKIYIIGGSRNAEPIFANVRTVEVYDPATDTWSQVEEQSLPRGAGIAVAVDGKIYNNGGYGSTHYHEEYDPLTGTWTMKTPMPTKRIGLSAGNLDGKIYVIGGHVNDPTYIGVNIVEVYDPASDTWALASEMPTGRYGASVSVVDGKIYVIGGMQNWLDADTPPAYGIVEVFEP